MNGVLLHTIDQRLVCHDFILNKCKLPKKKCCKMHIKLVCGNINCKFYKRRKCKYLHLVSVNQPVLNQNNSNIIKPADLTPSPIEINEGSSQIEIYEVPSSIEINETSSQIEICELSEYDKLCKFYVSEIENLINYLDVEKKEVLLLYKEFKKSEKKLVTQTNDIKIQMLNLITKKNKLSESLSLIKINQENNVL